MPANEQVTKYYDALLESYDILINALEKSNERGLKMSRQFTTEVVKGQREAIELGKKLASEPTDISQFYTAVLEATTSAQGRALAFTQAAYEEALGASADTRETIEKLVEVNREASQAAVQVAQSWFTANPMADSFRRTMEAFTPPTTARTTRKEKAEKTPAGTTSA